MGIPSDQACYCRANISISISISVIPRPNGTFSPPVEGSCINVIKISINRLSLNHPNRD